MSVFRWIVHEIGIEIWDIYCVSIYDLLIYVSKNKYIIL